MNGNSHPLIVELEKELATEKESKHRLEKKVEKLEKEKRENPTPKTESVLKNVQQQLEDGKSEISVYENILAQYYQRKQAQDGQGKDDQTKNDQEQDE